MHKITSLVAAFAVGAAIVSLPMPAEAAPVAPSSVPVAAAPVPTTAAAVPVASTPFAASAPTVDPTLIPSDPAGGLAGAFAGSPLSLVQLLLCPVVTGVAGLTTNIPGVGPIVNLLPSLVCSISIAGYVYRTTYVPPIGPPVVRYTKALAGVPTPINVDGQGLVADFVGTLGLNLTLNGITLFIQRGLGVPASARVSIEAVAINPTTPNTYVGFGEDGTAAGTARNWSAKLSVLGLSSTTVDLGMDIKTANPPSTLAALGEMFSGPNPDAPERTYRGLAHFSPVPDAFKTEVRLASGRQQVIVNSPPTKLTADVDVLTPGRAQSIDVEADTLPSSIDVVHTTTTTGDLTTYDASAPIAKLTGTYRDNVGGGNIEAAAALDAWGVPAHISFDQTAEKTTVGAVNGKFDRIQARFAQGSDVGPLNPSTSPFANFHRTTTEAFKGSLQLTNLKSVELDQAAPYGGRLIFDTAPGLFPFTADDDVTSTHLEGHLSNLPADTSVEVDLDNGLVTYDGHGTGIQEIAVKATRSTPFFARATRVDLTVNDLPAVMTVDYKQTNGAVTFKASDNGIGAVSLLASNGAGAPVVPAGDYASYEDTPSLYRVYARILGIKEVTFNADPLSGTIKTTSPQVMNLFVNLADATHDMKVNGRIDKIPSHIDFDLILNGGLTVFEYDSHGQPIDEVTLDGTGLYNLANGSALPLGIDTLHAEIEDVPDHLRAVLSTSNGTSFTFAPRGQNEPPNNETIGRILLQAYPSSAGAHNSVAGHQTAYGNLQTGQFTADLHNIGDTFFQITDSGQNMGYTISSAPLDYEFVLDDGKFLKGQISNPTPATINLNMSNKVDVHYRAKTDTQINSITLKTDLAGGYIDVNLQNIAPDVKVCFSETNKACKPGFVPTSVLTTTDGDTYNMPPALFDFSLTPTNLAGAPWPNRFEVDGTFCFDESNPATCLNGSNKKKRITITDLRFGKVAVGAGFREDGCDLCTAGRVYGYFDTDNTLISGDVKYFDEGDDGPFVRYETNGSDSSGIQAQNKLLFVQYCIVCLNATNLTTVSGGSFTCVAEPHLLIDIPVFDDLDVLSGSFIHFC